MKTPLTDADRRQFLSTLDNSCIDVTEWEARFIEDTFSPSSSLSNATAPRSASNLMPNDFKLQPPSFAGPDGSAPRVGDRYVYRDRSAVAEFPILEQRTLRLGAVFRPSPCP